MRKVIMGVGTFLVVVGLIQLILSVALIGPVRAQVGEFDPLIEDAAGMLTDMADSADRGVAFLADLDPTLADVEDTIVKTIDDSVRQLGEMDASLAVTERELGAILDGSVEYLGELDTALADVDGVAAATIDGTLIFLENLGATLADVDETLTGMRDDVIFTRNSITDMLEQLVVEVRAEDLEQLVAPVDTVLADAERTVAGMTAGVEAARDATKEWLEPIEVRIRPEHLIGWADWIEVFGVDATWLYAEADRWKREGLVELALGPGEPLIVGPEEVAGLFAPAIENLRLAEVRLADASAWLQYWPALLERLEEVEAPLRLFPLEMTADDVDLWADEVEAAGLDPTWLREQADFLRQEGLMWSLTPEDFARPFTLVIEKLELALDSLAYTSEYLGTLQDNLEEVERIAAHNIARTREFLGTALVSLEVAKGPTLDGVAGTRELLGTAQTSLGEIKTPALDGISDTRGYLRVARVDVGAVGDSLRDTRDGIIGLGIGGMIGDMIGWLQTYMIINSILFMAAGAGLFLVGMKKAEKQAES